MAHTLTFSESDFSDVGITVLVNGTSVSSPYILKNGDYITLDSAATIAINGTSYQNNAALNLSDTDIAITRGSKPNRYTTSPAIAINYTETVSRKSVDLTTLPGWSSLSDGSHSITIVAKAENYRDSEPSAAVSVEKAAAMPVKGDIITLDSKQYRVLKIEGTVAEVLAMYDSTASQAFNTSGTSNAYANSSLDVYLSQTFYNSLSTTMQNALVAKTFQQDSWYYGNNSSAIAKYNGTYQTTNTYTLSLMSTTFGASISRKCYVLSCQDVIDYLEVTTSMGSADTTLTSENVWKMFWNQTTAPGAIYPWLRSALSGSSNYAFSVYGRFGNLYNDRVSYTHEVRPAFQIDLSKIAWSK